MMSSIPISCAPAGQHPCEVPERNCRRMALYMTPRSFCLSVCMIPSRCFLQVAKYRFVDTDSGVSTDHFPPYLDKIRFVRQTPPSSRTGPDITAPIWKCRFSCTSEGDSLGQIQDTVVSRILIGGIQKLTSISRSNRRQLRCSIATMGQAYHGEARNAAGSY